MVRKMPKRGFTLIEVVIALVIFVIGALAVIRIFPPTFSAVQNSSYRNIATRLADSIVDQMRGEGSTPEAVFDTDDTDSDDNGIPDWLESTGRSTVELSWQDQDGAVEGTTSKNGSLPVGPTEGAYDQSALSHFRFVRGEVSAVQNSDGSGIGDDGNPDSNNHPYVLTNFPYTAAPNGGVRLFANREIKGVTIDAEGRLDFTNADVNDSAHKQRPPEIIVSSTDTDNTADNYAVQIYRTVVPQGTGYADTGARFYVSYRYVDGNTGNINSVINEPISFPSDNEWDNEESSGNDDVNYVLQGLLRKKLAANKPIIIPGAVRVMARAAFVVVSQDAGAPTLSTIVEGTTPAIPLGTDQDAGDVGYLPIPIVYTKKDFDAGGGDTVTGYYSAFPVGGKVSKLSVDYLVPDWRILLDQQMRTNGTNTFVLPVNILTSFTPKGVAVGKNFNYQPVDAVFPASSVKNQTVTYSVSYPTIRTAYKALDQWATQISPAAQSYVPFIENTAITSFRDPGADAQHYYLPREPWREYYWAAGANTLYFHPSEAGKTVKVKFIPNGATQAVDKILTISKDIIPTPTGAPADFGNFAPSGFAAELVLNDSSGNPVNASGILGVTGMSVLARTAWLNGKNYAQAISTGYR